MVRESEQHLRDQTDADRAWQRAPDLVVAALEERAVEHYRQGRLDRAAELLERLVLMRPSVGYFWTILGAAYRRQGQIVYATKAFERALAIDEDDGEAMVNLAESLVLAGKVEQGAQLLRAVFERFFRPGVDVADQSQITCRAAAQLAILADIARRVGDADAQIGVGEAGRTR